MNRIANAFSQTHHKKAIIPFLVAGYPTYAESEKAFETLLAAGADVLEIGIPYSDPLADGPVIQNASAVSLANGFSLEDVFILTESLRKKTDKALILFTYINPILQYGIRKFCETAALAGADGMIIPDLPLEEANDVRKEADKVNLALIPLVAPTSDESRIQAIAENARGFLYCVSALGVTGERTSLSDEAQRLVTIARKYTHLPVAVGFGIKSPNQAKKVTAYADGVIVGSAYIRRIEQCLALNGSGNPYTSRKDDTVTGNGLIRAGFDRVVDSLREFTAGLVTATNPECFTEAQTVVENGH